MLQQENANLWAMILRPQILEVPTVENAARGDTGCCDSGAVARDARNKAGDLRIGDP